MGTHIAFGTKEPIDYHTPDYNLDVRLRMCGSIMVEADCTEDEKAGIAENVINIIGDELAELSGRVTVANLLREIPDMQKNAQERLKGMIGADARVAILSISLTDDSAEELSERQRARLAN